MRYNHHAGSLSLPWSEPSRKGAQLPTTSLPALTASVRAALGRTPAFAAAARLLGDASWRAEVRQVARLPRAVRARARRAAEVGAVLDACRGEVAASPSAEAYARRYEAIQYFGGIVAAGLADDPILATLVHLSNALLDLLLPAHADAVPLRQRDVVRAGDGFPDVQPFCPGGHRRCRLLDERAFLVVPEATYVILDHFGDPHEVVGPAPEEGSCVVGRDRFRAWFTVGRAQLYKGTERLGDIRRSQPRWRAWPYETRYPGVQNPGARDGVRIDVREYLRIAAFGVLPPPEGLGAESAEADEDVPVASLSVDLDDEGGI